MRTGVDCEWRKACDCRGATASGPRVVQSFRTDPLTLDLLVNFALVEVACDRCDTPWKWAATQPEHDELLRTEREKVE